MAMDFIKLDIEGSQLDALLGAGKCQAICIRRLWPRLNSAGTTTKSINCSAPRAMNVVHFTEIPSWLRRRLSGTALAGSRPACAIAQGVFRMFPKLQQDSCKYYRSIDSVGNKILSVALGGKANRGKGRRNDGNVSTNEIAI